MIKISVAVLDDDVSQTEYLSSLVDKWSLTTGNSVALKSFCSSESFLFEYEENKSFDILLLDIQMSGIDGIELAKLIRKQNRDIQIIFVTGYEDYISAGYDVEALHYLLKPVNPDKLFEVLSRAVGNLKKSSPRVLLNSNGEMFRINISDIFYAEAVGHSVKIYLTDSDITFNQSLSYFKSLVGEDFIFTHRSYLVNLLHIQKISKSELTLDNGMTVPVSRRLYDNINKAFIAFYGG